MDTQHFGMQLAEAAEDVAWTAHPTFAGVWMKHLVRGGQTNGLLSCHLVRLDPGCELESHVHETQWELHEVAQGGGQAELSGVGMAYAPGVITVIPQGEAHQVRAGVDGLWLLAKFFPALV